MKTDPKCRTSAETETKRGARTFGRKNRKAAYELHHIHERQRAERIQCCFHPRFSIILRPYHADFPSLRCLPAVVASLARSIFPLCGRCTFASFFSSNSCMPLCMSARDHDTPTTTFNCSGPRERVGPPPITVKSLYVL